MSYTIKQRILSGQEASGGYNYLLVEIDAAADIASMPDAQDGSVAYIKDDDETIYVKISGTWTALDKSTITEGEIRRFDGIDPHTLLAANYLFPRRAEQNAERILTTATLPTTEAGLYEGLSIYDKTEDVPLWCKTPGEQEDDTVTVTQGAITKAGNVTITLNGVAKTVAVAKDDTAAAVAGKIRSTAFTGWTTGGSGAVCTFLKDAVGACSAPTAVDTDGTGVTFGSFTRTNQGVTTVWVSPADDTITDTGSKLTATTIDGAIDEMAGDISTLETSYAASKVTVADAGDIIAADNVEDALQEIAGDISTLETSYAASKVTVADAGEYLTSTNTEDAIQELASQISTITSIHQYIIKWDKTNSQCSRMGDAESITTTLTNFGHFGSINGSYDNPFDDLYPWKYRKLCKVDRTAYAALVPGAEITDCVTAWEGDPGWALDGTGDFDGVYTPEFWARIWEDATYVYVGVADGALPGWTHFEATIGGRYFGSLDGSSKLTSIALSIPYRGVAVSTMHTNATSQELTLDDIFTWCADTILMCVEYATLNSETAIGKGADELYLQTHMVGEAAMTGATVLKLKNEVAAACVTGAVIDFGTTDGALDKGSTIYVSHTDLEGGDPLVATHKAVTVQAITADLTTDHYSAVHGYYNSADAALGSMSGYIGTNGKCNAYYRGRVSHANYYRYILGAYRQTGTGNIWVANSRAVAAAADALATGTHRDTGLVLPEYAANYIATLGLDSLLPLGPFGLTVSAGGSTDPIGDYCITPTLATGDTVLLAGGYANHGSYSGRFSGSWSVTASSSAWNRASLPFLLTP